MTLTPLAVVCLALLTAVAAGQETDAPQHSFKAPFFSNIPNWNFFGSTVLVEDAVRLTGLAPNTMGLLSNIKPLKAKEFSISFRMRMGGGGPTGGNGVALWLTSEQISHTGAVHGAPDYWSGIGIFFDSYDEVRQKPHSLIHVVKNDGGLNYGAVADTLGVSAGHCWRSLREADLYITVEVAGNMLKVLTSYHRNGAKSPCLSVAVWPPLNRHYISFSASTGTYYDMHQLLEVQTKYLSDAEPENNNMDAKQGVPAPQPTSPQPTPPVASLPPLPSTLRMESLTNEQFQQIQNRLKKVDHPTHDPVPTDDLREQKLLDIQKELLADSTKPLEALIHDVKEHLLKLRNEVTELKNHILSADAEVHNEIHNLQEQNVVFAQSFSEIFSNVLTNDNFHTYIERASQESQTIINQVLGSQAVFQDLQRSFHTIEGQLGNMKSGFEDVRYSVLGEVQGMKRTMTEQKAELMSLVRAEVNRIESFMSKHSTDNSRILTQRIEETTSWGFWTYIIIFQILFLVALYVIGSRMKASRRKSDHLF